jgi:Mce-associated membrane protein
VPVEPPVAPSAEAVEPAIPASTAAVVPADSARRSWATTGCMLIACAALVFAVVSGVVWWRADHDSARSVAAARDAVTFAARVDIATVNTSDYRNAAGALQSWLSVSTGPLAQQFAQSKMSAIALLQKAKVITKATVLDAAPTALDVGKGTATVIASVDVVRTPVSGSPTTSRNRFRASMQHIDGQWKLADLTIVSVQL